MLGADRNAEFSMAKVEAMTIDPQAAMAKREAVRATISRQLATQAAKPERRSHLAPVQRRKSDQGLLRLAVGSVNGQNIDAHFGHLRELLIYQVSANAIHLIERREIARYCHCLLYTSRCV